ncbi:GNAT family N-acetyltransferase [Actinomycetospora cinnamomea]|uniref:CelD/BcsL family acetyltransferase involved in cellulose biosynthesis n=1 Tax=Actinomycetospora cinnamomea TaxID=663609 RepID=A0A2U1EXE8_9PSEU|nr:GNAT family N-acetyltransferase [Actinomycetospora cinnamomea]PVZ04579.1 CelD/BcsL family acetyltransferase involved in cellulose biosynthesis [Actinomycetospora cinnamomea]
MTTREDRAAVAVAERAPEVEAPAWTTAVITDLAGLRALRADLDRLYRADDRAMPFLSPGWLEAWWAVYGRRGRLRLVTVREDGVLRAAAPFHLVRRLGVRVLVPLGGALADHTDVLLDRPDRVAPVLVEALLPLADVIDAPEVPPTANLRRLVDHWPRPVLARPSSTAAVLPALPMDQLLAGYSSRTRGHRRREVRSVTEAGVHHRELPADEVGGGIARLLTLHRDAWRDRSITPEHTRPRFADFLTRATRAMVRSGDAALLEHRIDDEVVAVELVLLGRDTAGGYLYGHRPELRSTLNVTAMLLAASLSLAARRGLVEFSMLRGGESHKDRWHPRTVRHDRLVLPLRDSVRARAYVTGRRALAAARGRLREDARARAVVERLRSGRRVLGEVGRGRR